MPDAVPPIEEPEPVIHAVPRRRRSGIFRDPVVRRMAYAAVALVILFLATVVGALVTGVIGTTGPRTLTEEELLVSGDAVRRGSKDPAVWGQYISALISSRQYSRAESVIADAKASVDDSATAEITLGEVRLYSAQKDYALAIKSADKAMKQIQDVHKKRLAGGGMVALQAKNVGFPENYYNAVLLKAYIYRDTSKWDEAIKQYDIYLKRYPTASDILVDRGDAKIEAGDKAGAGKDFKAALKYVPDDEEALAGLNKIGASK